MVNDKETKLRLLKCGMKEFSDKGYMKASLRNICKEAGVTTGALYFFFKDKEDLFGSIVHDPLSELQELLESHFKEELEASYKIYNGEITIPEVPSIEGYEDDMEIAVRVVKLLFKHKKAFELLLTKAQGSAFENYPDQMVKLVEKHYLKMFAVMKGYGSADEITKEDEFIVHWMSHDQIDIFIHVLTHCKTQEQALSNMRNMMAYIIGGWLSVIRNK